MSDCSKTHVLRISTLGSQTTRQWYRMDDGSVEADPAVIAQLEASLTEEDCVKGKLSCIESQEWTYGIDNTGTTPLWDAEYKITLSDGSALYFEQTPQASGSSWTPQMQEWGANIQAAADASGLKWFVDTRYRNPSNPSSLAGGGGFAGPPSVAVSEKLTSMLWRYVNIQICPGQPVPVSAEIVSHTGAGPYPTADSEVGKALTTDGAVLGPIQKFFVCRECGESPIWYLEDGVTEAAAGQIPNCWEPCGTLALTDAPPDRECTFKIDVACDNNNSTNTADFTNTITRRATLCSGSPIQIDYFQTDPGDSSALIPYTLVGDFVDCATGDPIDVPTVDGVVVDCEGTIEPESFDSDVRLIGSKNPIAVFIKAQCSDYIRTEDIKLCEIDARFLLLIDSGGVFGRYSFYTKQWENVSTLSVASAGGSADVENFLLYNFVSPDQLSIVDVNTDTQLPNITVIDGTTINPNVTTNPKTFSAASFRESNGQLYSWDTAGADAGIYRTNVSTGEVNFVTGLTGVSGTGTSIAIDNTTDTLIVNGTNLSYQVDWVTGVATQWANPPVRPNGSTFDTDGNFYVTEGPNTYMLPAGLDGNDPASWVQLIDDFSAGANSIAYYEVKAQSPSCFFRRYGVKEDGTRELIGDFNVADDSPRTVVGDVDCCGTGGGADTVSIDNFPTDTESVSETPICAGDKLNAIRKTVIDSDGNEVVTFHDETGEIPEPAVWRYGQCDCEGFDYWEVDASTVTGNLRDRQWHDTAPVVPLADSNTASGRAFRESHDFTLTPDSDVATTSLALNDIDNTAGELDTQVKEGFIIADEGQYARYTATSEGYSAIELGCNPACGLDVVGEAGGFPMDFPATYIPAGIHQARFWGIDSGGSNHSASFQTSPDKTTWTTNNTAFQLSQTKPKLICKRGTICNGVRYGEDGSVITEGNGVFFCKPECSSCGGGSGSRSFTTAFDSEFFTSALTVPSAPADTKEAMVFNDSGAWLELTTSVGTQIVPPGGTANFSINDYEVGFAFSAVTILQGTFSGSDRWGINYRTAA